MTDDLGGRSYFIADEEPSKARLRIQNVKKSDKGLFRCRVDFVNSPTRNYQVNLSLIGEFQDFYSKNQSLQLRPLRCSLSCLLRVGDKELPPSLS